MSFILSSNRDNASREEARKNWIEYQAHLAERKRDFPQSAFGIATSSWWYQFDHPEAPHDARLVPLKMGEYDTTTRECQKRSWIEMVLQSAQTGIIILRYPEVFRYDMKMTADSMGLHGDWRYDEFSLSSDGQLLHTIEWADGATWILEASDLQHRYMPEAK